TSSLATFLYPVYFAYWYGMETGNLVPFKMVAPPGVPEDKMDATFKCEYMYIFDLTCDKLLPSLLEQFEDHVKAHPDFNIGNRGRRAWQDPRGTYGKSKLNVASRMFARRNPYNARNSPNFTAPYTVHPWILNVLNLQTKKVLIPNPERPQYMEFLDGKIRRVDQSGAQAFRKGNVIMMSFRMGMAVRGDNWFSEIIPLEFIRVASMPTNSSSDSFSYPTDLAFKP
ncbi:hypothetical protein CPB83DRAFT_748466, partial [Crepidotus variabilis]